ncbi:carbon-nitrogen hydrolase family protein [Klugiella xanthotipulae]|uniref:Putative amidohydrolase n=1 Tax=Klugiella xanthotipulae TaxID=244735 RepID=A0A543HXN8_9MICO|nr:carbon-nitrogen hydrolase family protein [Klugiella xanthotipulae]TQM63107.1 putative amidohydrolase [Klugiella xanthotipulae]
MSDLSVAIVQFAPTDNPTANREEVVRLAHEAAGLGATLIVFPEYSSYFTPRLGAHTVAAAESLDGPFVSTVRETARLLRVYIVCGFVEKLGGTTRCSNTLVALGPAGEIATVYRKIHLYDAFGQRESDWVTPGEVGRAPIFTVAGFTVGLQTCYDLRFPEVTRWLMDAGAQLVLVPAEWVAGELKLVQWRTLLAARAIENTVYVAAADHAPPVAVGHSVVLDPRGVYLAGLEGGSGIALASLSLDALASVRSMNPALALRRFGVAPLREDAV